MILLTDSFGQSAHIKIPRNIKKLVISMSGGADSAILCYIVAKHFKEIDSDIVIHPFSCNWEVRPWSQEKVTGIVDFIKEETGYEHFGQIYKFTILNEDIEKGDDHKARMFGNYTRFMLVNNLIDHFFSGKTANPSMEVMEKFKDQVRQKDRDKPTIKSIYKDTTETVPFAMVDKRFIIDMYKRNNLLNTLLPLTRSCEGSKDITDNFKSTCGLCWWCNEREWALKQVNG